MEEIDEGTAPEETTLAGTPIVAPAGDDGGAYGQPEVQYAKRSVVPVIIGAIYSLAQVPEILAFLYSFLLVALVFGDYSLMGSGVFLMLDFLMLAISCVGLYAGILMIQYKKRGIHIALGLIAVGFVMNLMPYLATGLPVPDGLVATSGICAALVAVPLLVSGISEQME